jgi:hypothetical protein
MISPEQRKEIIVLLKILQDEAKWKKIYAYVNSVLRETDDLDYPMVACEPAVTVYRTDTHEIWMTEDEAQEILEAYETGGGKSALSDEEWLEIDRMAKYYKKHPEELIPWEKALAEVDAEYGL